MAPVLGGRDAGQVSSFDFIIAMMLFLFVFITLHSIWTNNFDSAVLDQMRTQMHESGYKALEALVKSPGYPVNWEDTPGSTEIIGLASKKNILDNDKVEAFRNFDYNTSKELMDFGNVEYYFTLEAKNPANSFTKGNAPAANREIYALSRIAEYEGAEAIVTLQIFDS